MCTATLSSRLHPESFRLQDVMSMFDNASQTFIQGGQFANVLGGDAHFHVGESEVRIKRDLDRLLENVATGAFYDAAERGDPPKCHPKTRLAILAEIQKWVRDPKVRQTFILWLYGPAGAGKSAIAQTIADILAKEGMLVASFFFSRTGTGRNDTTRFVASIAYQLSLSIPEARKHIATAVEHDPLVFSRTMLRQMQVLIIQPLNAAAASANSIPPRVVIIDGLDEASKETTQEELLKALASSIQQLHIPLIFLVASRPEYVIRHAFNSEPLQSLMHGLALDEDYKPDDDIRIFLLAKFGEIRKSHPSGNLLPVPWPNHEDMDYLVRKASGQFIYASTVVKYVSSPRDNPKKQLQIILGLSDPGKDTPFAQLDALYHHILSSVKDISRVLEILSLVFLQTTYDYLLSVDFIETLLGYDSGDVAAALTDMHALVYVPSPDSGDNNDELRMYHASLRDFLFDRSRSERFFLDARVRHTDIVRRLLHYITTRPKSAYEKDILDEIINGFIHYYSAGSHTDDLVADLEIFSLATLLSDISMPIFRAVSWDVFFNHLRNQCGSTNAGLYRRLIGEFDSWICTRYEQYPEFIQNLISGAYAIPCGTVNGDLYLPDIFNILAHSLSRSDAILLRNLDKELFKFQNISSLGRDDYTFSTLQNFFSDPSRAGVHFADGVKAGKLAEEIVKVLCRRDEDALEVVVEDYIYKRVTDLEWFSTLDIRDDHLIFFPEILNAASADPKLAQHLWKLAVQYNNDDSIAEQREVIADACLEYIKRCGIYIPEHKHGADCGICADYKPVFPSLSLEPEIEPVGFTISTPNQLDTTQSGLLVESLPYISLESPPMTQSNPNATSSPHSLYVRHSTTATRNRTTKLPLSTTLSLSNPQSISSLSPLATRSTRTPTRPSSADLSTSSHRPNSSSLLSATSRAQTSNRASSSSPSYLSPDVSSASGITQSSTSNLSQQKGKSLGRNVTASAAVPRRPSSKSAPKKPTWK